MSVIIRLQGLPWSASAMDIRQFFKGLSVPPGGVHIIGGEKGDAFIAFVSDEDARRAMMLNNNFIDTNSIQLFLSSKTEMQNIIGEARNQSTQAPIEQPSQIQQTPPQPHIASDFSRPTEQQSFPPPERRGESDRGYNRPLDEYGQPSYQQGNVIPAQQYDRQPLNQVPYEVPASRYPGREEMPPNPSQGLPALYPPKDVAPQDRYAVPSDRQYPPAEPSATYPSHNSEYDRFSSHSQESHLEAARLAITSERGQLREVFNERIPPPRDGQFPRYQPLRDVHPERQGQQVEGFPERYPPSEPRLPFESRPYPPLVEFDENSRSSSRSQDVISPRTQERKVDSVEKNPPYPNYQHQPWDPKVNDPQARPAWEARTTGSLQQQDQRRPWDPVTSRQDVPPVDVFPTEQNPFMPPRPSQADENLQDRSYDGRPPKPLYSRAGYDDKSRYSPPHEMDVNRIPSHQDRGPTFDQFDPRGTSLDQRFDTQHRFRQGPPRDWNLGPSGLLDTPGEDLKVQESNLDNDNRFQNGTIQKRRDISDKEPDFRQLPPNFNNPQIQGLPQNFSHIDREPNRHPPLGQFERPPPTFPERPRQEGNSLPLYEDRSLPQGRPFDQPRHERPQQDVIFQHGRPPISYGDRQNEEYDQNRGRPYFNKPPGDSMAEIPMEIVDEQVYKTENLPINSIQGAPMRPLGPHGFDSRFPIRPPLSRPPYDTRHPAPIQVPPGFPQHPFREDHISTAQAPQRMNTPYATDISQGKLPPPLIPGLVGDPDLRQRCQTFDSKSDSREDDKNRRLQDMDKRNSPLRITKSSDRPADVDSRSQRSSDRETKQDVDSRRGRDEDTRKDEDRRDRDRDSRDRRRDSERYSRDERSRSDADRRRSEYDRRDERRIREYDRPRDFDRNRENERFRSDRDRDNRYDRHRDERDSRRSPRDSRDRERKDEFGRDKRPDERDSRKSNDNRSSQSNKTTSNQSSDKNPAKSANTQSSSKSSSTSSVPALQSIPIPSLPSSTNTLITSTSQKSNWKPVISPSSIAARSFNSPQVSSITDIPSQTGQLQRGSIAQPKINAPGSQMSTISTANNPNTSTVFDQTKQPGILGAAPPGMRPMQLQNAANKGTAPSGMRPIPLQNVANLGSATQGMRPIQLQNSSNVPLPRKAANDWEPRQITPLMENMKYQPSSAPPALSPGAGNIDAADPKGMKRRYRQATPSLSIVVKNLPLNSGYRDVRKFFQGCEIPWDGLKMLNDQQGKRTGVAYINFCSSQAYFDSLEKKQAKLNDNIIEVQPCSKEDYDNAIDSYMPPKDHEAKKARLEENTKPKTSPQKSAPKDNIVQVKGWSSSVTLDELKKFFKDLKISDKGNAVYLEHDQQKRPTGMAMVKFENELDFNKAITMDMKLLVGKAIHIKSVSQQELSKLIEEQKKLGTLQAALKDNFAGGDSQKTEYTCVHLQGLPSYVTVQDLQFTYFTGIEFGNRGMHLVLDSNGKSLGEAFAEFSSESECGKALQKDGEVFMGKAIIVKPILKTEMNDMLRMIKQPMGRHNSGPQFGRRSTFYVKTENWPFTISIREVLSFFQGYNPIQETVRVQIGNDMQGSAAMVGFRTQEDAERAVKTLNNKYYRQRPIRMEPALM